MTSDGNLNVGGSFAGGDHSELEITASKSSFKMTSRAHFPSFPIEFLRLQHLSSAFKALVSIRFKENHGEYSIFFCEEGTGSPNCSLTSESFIVHILGQNDTCFQL